MSVYTTQLRYVCEEAIGLKHSSANAYDVIREARPLVFNFPYPIFDVNYKQTLEEKIMAHYYMREIGAETVGLWKFYLQRKMNEIMPYYNQLYESALIEFNPMEDTKLDRKYNLTKNDNTNNTRNVDENTTYKRNASGNNNADQTGKKTGDNWTKVSDTPQGGLDGVISTDYLSQATENTVDQNATSNTKTNYSDNIDDKTVRNNTDKLTGNFTANDNYFEHLTGKSSGKSFSAMLNEFRETFLNIDMMVINELEPLFMQLWDID